MIMGAICFAVSLRTLAGSSSGPVALFWFRFSNCFLRHLCQFREGDVGVNRGGYLGGKFYWVNTELNWLLRHLLYRDHLLLAGRLLEVWECQCFLIYLP